MAGETVLVADDRLDNLDFMREYVLEPNGYHMIAARNGEEALHVALSQDIDLIISDLVMPQMGGLELLENLRNAGSQLPAILMTFHGSEETAVRAFRLGARDYIIKPFSIEEMLGAIDRALSEARLRKERDQLTGHLMEANRQLGQRVQELQILFSIGRSVTSLLDLEQVLNRIVEAAVYLSKAQQGSLILVDESGGLVQRAIRRPGERQARGSYQPVSDSLAEAAIKRDEPILRQSREQAASGDGAAAQTDWAALVVPLKVGTRAIGALAVRNPPGARPFSQRHLNLLIALADYASIVIENARLYAKLAEEADEATRYGRVLEREVERSERLSAMGHLVAGVARELNAPLETIWRHAQSLAGRLDDVERSRRLLESIEQEALRGRQTLRSLLIYAGQTLQAKQPTDVNLLLERVWEQLQHEKELPATLQLDMGLDPRLPLVQAEQVQLERAFYYILRSACESMPMGGELRLITRRVGPEVQVILTDSGAGIPAEEMQHLFDPFYKTSRHAYGLGLSIAHGVIERHAGRIEVESQVGHGTTFTIYVPVEGEA